MTKTDISKSKPSGKSKDTRQSINKSNDTELAQLKEALKTSEDNFSSLLERNADGIIILDA